MFDFKPLRLLARFGLLIIGSSLLGGCAHAIAPWERGHLAKPHMALEPHPAERGWRMHAYGSREAAAGGGMAAGGGCGCY